MLPVFAKHFGPGEVQFEDFSFSNASAFRRKISASFLLRAVFMILT